MIPEKYYTILGLNAGASLQEIKRAYRRLAKLHHPDRSSNPASAQIFINITEAYDILTGQRNLSRSNSFGSERNKKQTVEDRVEKARVRFQQRQQKEALENEKYYQNIAHGKRYKKYKIIAFSAALLGLLLFFDSIIPGRKTKEEVTGVNIESTSHGLHYDQITTINLNNKGNLIWINREFARVLMHQKEVVVQRSYLFHDIQKIYAPYENQWAFSLIDYSSEGISPNISILLFCPLIVLLFRSKTILYSFLFNVNYYIFTWVIILTLLSNFRWLHLITLGFW